MKNLNIKLGGIALVLTLVLSIPVKANDVELRVPKSSIQNALDAFIHARFLSYGTETTTSGIDYYNVRIVDSDLTLITGNRFEIDLTFNAYINFEVLGFKFEHDYGTKVVTVEGDVEIIAAGNGYKILLNPDDFEFNESGLLFDALNLVSKGIVNQLPEISTTVKLPFLVSVATSYFTSTTPSISTTSDMVKVGFTLTAGTRYVTVANLVNGKDDVGNIQVVNGGSTTTYSSPKLFEWSSGSSRSVQTPVELLDESNDKNKYRHWINKDLVAQTDIATRRIQFSVTPPFDNVSAKFEPARRIELVNDLEGVTTGGDVTYDGTTTSSYDDYDFYSTTVQKTINSSVSNGTQGTNWSFWKWSDGNTNQQRNIIVNQNIDLEAEYKGSQRSNKSTTFKAGQRKVAHSPNDWEHMVYESLGNVWYEAKAPSGDWEFVEGPGGFHMGRRHQVTIHRCKIYHNRLALAIYDGCSMAGWDEHTASNFSV